MTFLRLIVWLIANFCSSTYLFIDTCTSCSGDYILELTGSISTSPSLECNNRFCLWITALLVFEHANRNVPSYALARCPWACEVQASKVRSIDLNTYYLMINLYVVTHFTKSLRRKDFWNRSTFDETSEKWASWHTVYIKVYIRARKRPLYTTASNLSLSHLFFIFPSDRLQGINNTHV